MKSFPFLKFLTLFNSYTQITIMGISGKTTKRFFIVIIEVFFSFVYN